jgi:hypothetical protein
MCCSGSDAGSMMEPIAAVPLNDELQESRALVAKAELDVLSKLTDKVVEDGQFDFVMCYYLMSAVCFLSFICRYFLSLIAFKVFCWKQLNSIRCSFFYGSLLHFLVYENSSRNYGQHIYEHKSLFA